jgi:hypothetical protein
VNTGHQARPAEPDPERRLRAADFYTVKRIFTWQIIRICTVISRAARFPPALPARTLAM